MYIRWTGYNNTPSSLNIMARRRVDEDGTWTFRASATIFAVCERIKKESVYALRHQKSDIPADDDLFN